MFDRRHSGANGIIIDPSWVFWRLPDFRVGYRHFFPGLCTVRFKKWAWTNFWISLTSWRLRTISASIWTPWVGREFQNSEDLNFFCWWLSGVAEQVRDLILSSSPTIVLTKKGDTYCFKSSSTLRDNEIIFKVVYSFPGIKIPTENSVHLRLSGTL